MMILADVIKVKPISDYKLYLRFDDGVSGEVDIASIVRFQGVFAKLADPVYFKTVKVNQDIGTICWENGADISPCTLRDALT